MSLFELSHWLQETQFATYIRESALTYPIVMTTHLACIAVFGGMILISDMRLLDWAWRDRPVSDVVGRLRVWKWLGFVIMVTCGFLLGIAKIELYYPNPFFRIKMTVLLLIVIHALVFRRSVYGNLAELDRAPQMPGRAKLAGVLSLVLWATMVCLGRWIAYWEPKREAIRPASTIQLVHVKPPQTRH